MDLLLGVDENAANHRFALICRHCRAHNGLAPPGERGDEVGYLCGRCGQWNGPKPAKKSQDGTSAKRAEQKMEEKKTLIEELAEEHNNHEMEIREEIGEKPPE